MEERFLKTIEGEIYSTPLFLPVYEYGNQFISMEDLKGNFTIHGIITNAFFLYKNRERKPLVLEQGIKKFFDFNGLIVTDSGAFQGFSRPLYLSNKKIIQFQQDIGADVISPLDLVTSPGVKRTLAAQKLNKTNQRIEEGLKIEETSILVGVQQGGRFLELRKESIEKLVELKTKYIALGSLVPFFNRNHDILFVGKVIRQAREIVPHEIPMHLYGAGDPVELPFFFDLGCDIFDSSAHIHYAKGNWYMTEYGALLGQELVEEKGYVCSCQFCAQGLENLWKDPRHLASHNLQMVLSTVERMGILKKTGRLRDYLEEVLVTHQKWFPESKLQESWESLIAEETP